MGVTVYNRTAEEWVKKLKGSRNFTDTFIWEHNVCIEFIKYVDERCGGWQKYYSRVWYYGETYDYIKELYYKDGLGRDKIWEFVYSHKGSLQRWLYDCGDNYILKFIKEQDSSIMEFMNSLFVKDNDLFITLCAKFIGYISVKLFKFVSVNEL